MKIFLLADSMDMGGAETHILTLAAALCRRGHAVTVLSAGGRMVAELLAVGADHIFLPSPIMHPVKALGALCRHIEARRPSVLHAHTRRTALLCRLASARFGTATVVTAHAAFSRGPLSGPLSYFPDPTIAVSHDLARLLVGRFGVPSHAVTVIPNGIDISRFAPAPPSEGPLTILSISRLDHDCAHTATLLCHLAPRLARALGRPLRVLIVGGGQALPALARQFANVREVSFLGARRDIPSLLSRCHVFVGVSRAALEAMAVGRPVILSGDEGYFGPIDPARFASAARENFCARGRAKATEELLFSHLFRLLARPRDVNHALGMALSGLVTARLSAKSMAAATERVYQKALALCRASRRSDILLCGYYGFGNLGDGLLLSHLCQALCAKGLRLSVVFGAHEEPPSGVAAVRRYRLFGLIRELRGTGAFVLGGGSLLQDATSLRSLYYYLALLRLARLCGRPTMLCANGLGPLSPSSLALCRRVLARVDVITLRDSASYRLVKGMGLSRPRIALTADPVMAQSVARRSPSAVPPYLLVCPKGRAWAIGAVARGVAVFALGRGLGVRVLAMNRREDGGSSAELAQRLVALGVKAILVTSPRSAKAVAAGAELVLSGRLHGLILSVAAGVPAVGLGSDPKLAAFLGDMGLVQNALGRVSADRLALTLARAERSPLPSAPRLAAKARASLNIMLARDLAGEWEETKEPGCKKT